MNCRDIAELSPLYHSGRLDAQQAEAFAGHLRTCSECARDIEIETRLREGLLAEEIDTAALDNRVRHRIAAGSSRRRLIAAGGIAAMVLIGFIIFRGADRVCVDAAKDHRREVVDRERRTWREDLPAIQQLAERQGVPVLVPAGYRLERGKLCRLDGQVFLHLVFTDGAQEFSLYLRPRGEEKLPSAVFVEREHVAAFQTDRVTALVVADQSGEAALRLARAVESVL